MANIFKPKRRTVDATAPTTANLADGEIAVNAFSKKIYMRDGAAIIELAPAGESGGGTTWSTITNANVNPAVTKYGYIMETGGTLRTVTLPASAPAGFSVTVNANAGQVRIVSNGNVIDQVGAGNDLLLDNGATAVLVAKAVGSLEILFGGASSTAPAANAVLTRVILSVAVSTAAGAAASTDYVYFVSGTSTITLPTAVGNTNRYTVANVGAGVVSIATTSAQTINGSASPITVAVNDSLDLISDGANWRVT